MNEDEAASMRLTIRELRAEVAKLQAALEEVLNGDWTTMDQLRRIARKALANEQDK